MIDTRLRQSGIGLPSDGSRPNGTTRKMERNESGRLRNYWMSTRKGLAMLSDRAAAAAAGLFALPRALPAFY